MKEGNHNGDEGNDRRIKMCDMLLVCIIILFFSLYGVFSTLHATYCTLLKEKNQKFRDMLATNFG